MSIHFISGKPGGGKTLYAVALILDELLHGTRPIYTNVPLRLAELNDYIQREHPGRVVDLVGRVRLLDERETEEFFCHRPAWDQDPISKDDWVKAHKRPNYEGVKDSGVFYAIDEIHNFFSARQWVNTGPHALYYISQHRKLGDTVLCVTQAIQNVDAQFRSVTQDFTFIRNFGKEKLGLFKLPSLFRRATYVSPPSDLSVPVETGYFRLDVSGIAACYDTAKGVSVHGRLADRQEKRKGLHWTAAVLPTVASVLLLFVFVPRVMGKMFAPKAAAVSRVASPAPAPAPAAVPMNNVAASAGVVVQQKPKVTGYARFGNKVFLCTTNGLEEYEVKPR